MGGRTLEQHVQGCLETAQFSEQLRGDSTAQSDFRELCIHRVRELAQSPGVRMSLTDYERQVDDAVRDFMQVRMAMLEAATPTQYNQQLAAVASFSFDARFGDISGRGNPAARLAGVRAPSEQGVLLDEYGGQKAHEFGHGASYVEVARNHFHQDTRGAFVQNSVAVTIEGWVMRVPEENRNGYREQFRVLDEVAATVITNAWYESQGWQQDPFTLHLHIDLNPERRFDQLLMRALSLVTPEVQVQPLTDRVGDDGETVGCVLPVPALRWSSGGEMRRSLYAPLLQALDLIAPEVYPHIPPQLAVSHLRERLVEVQAVGGHAAMLSRFEEALGSDGLRFLSRLEAPGNRERVSLDTALLSLYAMAGTLTDGSEKLRARECLHQAHDALLELRASLDVA